MKKYTFGWKFIFEFETKKYKKNTKKHFLFFLKLRISCPVKIRPIYILASDNLDLISDISDCIVVIFIIAFCRAPYVHLNS